VAGIAGEMIVTFLSVDRRVERGLSFKDGRQMGGWYPRPSSGSKRCDSLNELKK